MKIKADLYLIVHTPLSVTKHINNKIDLKFNDLVALTQFNMGSYNYYC